MCGQICNLFNFTNAPKEILDFKFPPFCNYIMTTSSVWHMFHTDNAYDNLDLGRTAISVVEEND